MSKTYKEMDRLETEFSAINRALTSTGYILHRNNGYQNWKDFCEIFDQELEYYLSVEMVYFELKHSA